MHRIATSKTRTVRAHRHALGRITSRGDRDRRSAQSTTSRRVKAKTVRLM